MPGKRPGCCRKKIRIRRNLKKKSKKWNFRKLSKQKIPAWSHSPICPRGCSESILVGKKETLGPVFKKKPKNLKNLFVRFRPWWYTLVPVGFTNGQHLGACHKLFEVLVLGKKSPKIPGCLVEDTCLSASGKPPFAEDCWLFWLSCGDSLLSLKVLETTCAFNGVTWLGKLTWRVVTCQFSYTD